MRHRMTSLLAALAISLTALMLSVTPAMSLEAQPRCPSKESGSFLDSLFFLDMSQLSDLTKWLPAPPDTIGDAFAYDLMRYFWGKTQRHDAERASIAISDADFSIEGVSDAFSVPFGLRISEQETPEIYTLLKRALETIDLICVMPKDNYMRKRPFMMMQEPTLTPEDEPLLSLSGSYHSAHTIRGWGAALLLAEICPAAADTLFARGIMYGESRVIVGVHWQSDVDAGLSAASAAFAVLHTSEAFMRQMTKAREEYNRLTGRTEDTH